MKKLSALLALMLCICSLCQTAYASENLNVIINGKAVVFTENSGYPYVDENNRTMVPLRVTMEAAGAAVGYDAEKSTAIVITEHDRIEIPIGTKILYNNNVEIQNDTESVANDGRTYLPIRAVLEVAGFTVEWDAKTSTVNTYTFQYDEVEFVPYSTSSLDTLLNNILQGNVVYINGNYYTTPEYMKLVNNTQMHYLGDDLNTALYPEKSRTDFSTENYEWISGINFDEILINKNRLNDTVKNFEKSEIPDYVYVYGFYKSEAFSIEIVYAVDEMTDEFMNLTTGEGTFNGIRMKKEDGILFFNIEDLKSKNLYN